MQRVRLWAQRATKPEKIKTLSEHKQPKKNIDHVLRRGEAMIKGAFKNGEGVRHDVALFCYYLIATQAGRFRAPLVALRATWDPCPLSICPACSSCVQLWHLPLTSCAWVHSRLLILSCSCLHLWSTFDAIVPSSKKKESLLLGPCSKDRDHALKRGEEMMWLGPCSTNIDHVLKKGEGTWCDWDPALKTVDHVLKRGEGTMWLGPFSKNIDHVLKRGQADDVTGTRLQKHRPRVEETRRDDVTGTLLQKHRPRVEERRRDDVTGTLLQKHRPRVEERTSRWCDWDPVSTNIDHVLKKGEDMMWLGPCSKNVDHVLKRGPNRTICTVSDTLLAAACQHVSRHDNQLLTFVDRNDDGRPVQWSMENRRGWSSSTGTASTSATELGFEPEVGCSRTGPPRTRVRAKGQRARLWVKGLECWACGARLAQRNSVSPT